MPEQTVSAKRILIMAPQPFYQDRGTPIAVRLLAAEVARLGHLVDLLVFHEGLDITISGVTIHRTTGASYLNNISPGFSFKKLVCDLKMSSKAQELMKKNRYDLIHAVEEAVFLAMRLSKKFNIPYVYDMDSSLPVQLLDKMGVLKPLKSSLEWFEKQAVKNSTGVVAVCPELAELAGRYSLATPIVCLEDIDLQKSNTKGDEDLREKYNVRGPLLLYVGNLESYQGIDLLLESIQKMKSRNIPGHLLIIGGSQDHIRAYQDQVDLLGISAAVTFCGPRDFSLLGYYLSQADILISPRTKGNNTPMKIYSYLGSGKAVIATNLPTHTQVLTPGVSLLCKPDPENFADGLQLLVENPEKREELGQKATALADERYSIDTYRHKLKTFYSKILET